MPADWILTLNAGSSSLKFSAHAMDGDHKISAGQVKNIDGNYRQALQSALADLDIKHPPSAIGHRVVHGGARSAACEITPGVHAEITAAVTLAPLHNPPALAVIDAVQTLFPNVPQIACFDTAFHTHNPPEATTIPIPKTLRDQDIRRYGFHGLSYASIVRRFSVITGQPLPKRVLAFHLGAGASLAAIVNGKSVATTMGFSPMDGLVMASRAGAMDAGVVLHLMRTHGLSADDIDDLLNKNSGLTALSGGISDMKTLLESGAAPAKFAVSHYCYWSARHAGSMIAAMEGVDAFVFTGGIGENAEGIRDTICKRLSWAKNTPIPCWVIPADEEGEIAQSVQGILQN
ncbi:MAG: acetate kinase [Paracoccaceae bacterium]